MNVWDILLLALIAGAVVLAVCKIHRDRKKGKGCLSCGGNCSGCGLACGQGEKRAKE